MRLIAGPSVFSVATSGLISPQSKLMVGRAAGSISFDGMGSSSHAWASALKRRMFSVIATSVGRRSMLEAPKKPTTPVGALQHVLRVLGLGERAAVAEHDHVGVDRHRRVAHRLDPLDALVERERRLRRRSCPSSSAPCAAPARRPRRASSPRPTRGRRRTARSAGPARRPRGSSRPRGRSPCRSPRGWRGTCRRSGRPSGSSARPAKPASRTSRRKFGMSRNGSVPQTPASTGVSRTTGSTSPRHLHDDRVGVAVRHQPGQRAAARPCGSGRSCR